MARSFNGSSTWLTRADILGFTDYPMSVAGWFNHAATTIGAILQIARTGSNDQYVGISVSAAHAVLANAAVGTADAPATSSTVGTINVWGHAAGVFASATDRAAFLNGGGKGTSATSRTWPVSIQLDTSIGRRSSSSPVNYFNGLLAEVGVWNVALDDAEVAALAAGFSPLLIRPQSLVAYWPIFGNDTDELDRWKNRYDLTVVNATKTDHPRIFMPTRGKIAMPSAAAAPVGGRMFHVF